MTILQLFFVLGLSVFRAAIRAATEIAITRVVGLAMAAI
jgi:hypothetical protein